MNTQVVPGGESFSLDLHQSDAHARADGRLSARFNGGHVIGRYDQSAVWQPVNAADVELRDNSVNYVEVSRVGVIVTNQAGFTDNAQRLYTISVASGNVTAIEDHRFR